MASVAEAFALAFQHHQAGNLPQAEQIYGLILQADPGCADALHLLGVCWSQMGRHEQAVSSIRKAVALNPSVAAYHSNLGLAEQALGRLDDAVASYRRALQLQPDLGDAQANLAGALLEQGKVEEAEKHARRAVLLQPHSAAAHTNLGYALYLQEKTHEAIAHYQEAIRIQPNFADAHNNLGIALKKMGKLDEAVASIRQALHFKPDFAEAFHNLADVWRSWPVESTRESWLAHHKHLEEAETCCLEALKIKPDYADAHATLGAVLWELGKKAEALASLEQALRASPTNLLRVRWATLLPVIYESMADVQFWRQRLLDEIRKLRESQVTLDLTLEPVMPLFFLAYQGLNDRDIQRQIAQIYRPPAPPPGLPAVATGSSSGKIRVGFLSSFFRSHTIGQWFQGLIAKLARDSFEVVVLSIGNHQDDTADFIRRHADRYVVVPSHLPSARRLIAEERLDVLLYPEIGMDHIANTLAYSRLAPIQYVTLGHPDTTGIGTIDSFISTESLETPESEQHYSETLIRLKTLPIYYYRPQLPAPLQERSYFGLSAEDHIYTCLQSSFKFHPAFDEFLGGILRGDPRGMLVLTQGLTPAWENLLRQRFAKTLPDALDRIRFFPMLAYRDYLNLVALADVQLDPAPFGSGSTSYDAFAVGTPVVTMPSQLMRGRITFALYSQMQILDCVASDPQEYINIALRLGMDSTYREKVRKRILDANGILFENSSGIRELEQFFRGVARPVNGQNLQKVRTEGRA